MKKKKIDIGITEKKRKEITIGLSKVLADSYSLYVQTHNFHWNVTGPMFRTVHLMCEGQYKELAIGVDIIAERIRALGYPAPGTFSEFKKLASIKEVKGVPEAKQMVQILLDGQESIIRTARRVIKDATDTQDGPTTDLLNQRMVAHEKNAWMLRSLIE
jgi:starvation-inducible DNA-binding protein